MPHLNTLGARVATLDTRTVKPQPKQTDPHYLTFFIDLPLSAVSQLL